MYYRRNCENRKKLYATNSIFYGCRCFSDFRGVQFREGVDADAQWTGKNWFN